MNTPTSRRRILVAVLVASGLATAGMLSLGNPTGRAQGAVLIVLGVLIGALALILALRASSRHLGD